MSDVLICAADLSHRYAREWALRNLSFKICQQGVVGLLGSNGAGKSTFMNIMCGVLYATKGDVTVNGLSVRDDPIDAKRQIGFLPQTAPVLAHLTVDEYLRHCAELKGVARRNIRAAVDEAKEGCGIVHFSKRLIGNLSGGYRQRVGLAQAIVHKPSVVVLDEPTNGFDPNQILAVRDVIREIAKARTVVLSTHILSEVEAVCDEILMIEQGELAFQGTMDEFASVVEPDSVLVSFRRPPAEKALLEVPGITSAKVISRRNFRLHIIGGRDTAEMLIRASVASDWGLREVTFEGTTLERVFARLSGEDDSAGKKELASESARV